MAHCITRAPRKPGVSPVAPRKSDGSQYQWAICLPGNGRIGWADTIPEMVGILVGEPDYVTMGPEDQAYHRIMNAIALQVTTQARINVIAQSVREDWDRACGWERNVLNGSRHVQPHGFDSAHLFEGRDVWTCDIPLVLVRTGYWPYSPVQPVDGTPERVWWVDPSTEEDFLDSLSAEPLGLIQVWRVSA